MKYILFVLSIVAIPGCADRRASEMVYTDVSAPNEPNQAFEEIIDEVAVDTYDIEVQDGPSSFNPKLIATRKLIRNGFINFEVKDIEATKKSIDDLVKELGGYMASDEQRSHNGGPQVEQVMRVPADKLDDFVMKVVGLAKSVRSKSISVKDVTEEFNDIETRLITKRELEKHYRELLHKAKNVTESLQMERELEDVRGEIESMEGRRQYLSSQVAFSTLSITYYQLIPVAPTEFAFGSEVVQSLKHGWENVLYYILDIIAGWPLVVLGSLPILFVFRWIRRRRLQPQQLTSA